MWPPKSYKFIALILLAATQAFACLYAAQAEPATENFSAQRSALQKRIQASENDKDVAEAACAKRFVVSPCVKKAKSDYYKRQHVLDKEMAALNTRERQYEAKLRAKDRAERMEENRAQASGTAKPTQTVKVQRTAQEAAASEADYKATQEAAKRRKAEHEAKLKAPAAAPKPPAQPRSANAAEMAAADAKEQARQRDIAVRKAEIDKKRVQSQGAPLQIDPALK